LHHGFISDTHSPLFLRNYRYKDIIENTHDYFLELCEKHNVTQVNHLGDMVHVKEAISLESLIFTHNQFRKIYKKYPTFCIPGNHDMISKKDMTLNFVKIFQDSAKVIDKVKTFEHDKYVITYLSFDSEENIIERVKNIQIIKGKKNYVFGHFGVQGFYYQEDGYTDKQDKITKSLFKNFDRVLLGHFHSHQTQDNITYVSSPYQQRFGDDGGKYGFTFFDPYKNEIVFEENIHTPKFIKLDLNKENLLIASKLENCFIKFHVKKNLNKQTQFKIKLAIEKNNFDVSFDYNIKREDTKIVKLKNWDNLITKDTDQIIIEAVDTLDETEEGKQIIKDLILVDDKKTKA
jgi:DNA repair exonuclease SbcCD nuclease subunit